MKRSLIAFDSALLMLFTRKDFAVLFAVQSVGCVFMAPGGEDHFTESEFVWGSGSSDKDPLKIRVTGAWRAREWARRYPNAVALSIYSYHGPVVDLRELREFAGTLQSIEVSSRAGVVGLEVLPNLPHLHRVHLRSSTMGAGSPVPPMPQLTELLCASTDCPRMFQNAENVQKLYLVSDYQGTVAASVRLFPRLEQVWREKFVLNPRLADPQVPDLPPASVYIVALVGGRAPSLRALLGDVDMEFLWLEEVEFTVSASLRPLTAMQNLRALDIDPVILERGVVEDNGCALAELQHLETLRVGQYQGDLQFVIDGLPSLTEFTVEVKADANDPRIDDLREYFDDTKVAEGSYQGLNRITFLRNPSGLK